jgi:hypothetical protein
MDVTTKTARTTLKSYFAKNATPTAGNFADLVDAALNQRDDGIAKVAGEPLSIQGEGDAASSKEVLHLYKSFADSAAAWSLSLNPRVDVGDATTAHGGLNIADAARRSRLFIDDATGNIGVGTLIPSAQLDVRGFAMIGSGTNYAARSGYMAAGSLTVGGTDMSYGGGKGWSANTAALMLETNANTEIAVSDAAHNVASLLYYESAAKRITIGRDAGWGATTQVVANGEFTATGKITAQNSDLYFTNTTHSHTGFGNTEGFAAIENSENYGCLMILGRQVDNTRVIGMWDQVTVHGAFINSSDLRAKQDVADLEYGLAEIRKLRPVSYNWRAIHNPHRSIGLIAQEVLPVISESVYTDDTSPDGQLGISYTSLIPVLVNAVKELASRVDELAIGSRGATDPAAA